MMKIPTKSILFALSLVSASSLSAEEALINRLIDEKAHRKATIEALDLRAKRRVTVDRFLELAAKPGTVILDTRSAFAYKLRHIKGAKHLNFSDFVTDKLAKVIPTKDTCVLIYCNNNFIGDRVAFASKMAPAALNLPTFIALHEYGYRNVYELGPVEQVNDTKIEFEGDLVEKEVSQKKSN